MNTPTPAQARFSPLAKLRSICGLTRDQLAAIAGISASSVQHIELKRSPMPPEVARRIEVATGCMAASLGKDSDTPLRLDGAPFDRASYDGFRNFGHDAEDVAAAVDDLSFRLGLLLETAGSKFVFAAVMVSDFLNDLAIMQARIPGEAIDAAARKRAKIETIEMTIAELLSKAPSANDLKEFVSKRGYTESDRCKAVLETYRVWPSMAPTNAIAYARLVTRKLFRIEFPDGERFQIATDDTTMKFIMAERTSLPEAGKFLPFEATPPTSKQSSPKAGKSAKPAKRRKRLSS